MTIPARRLPLDALRLIAITPSPSAGLDVLLDAIASVVDGGATMVQVRLKNEPDRVVCDFTRRVIERVPTVPVLVNDRFDLALAAGAHGAHLGADDIPAAIARRHVPPSFIIGTSVGCDAEVANGRHADYVGIGPVFASGSKADAGDAIGIEEFARLSFAVGVPAVAIGGITPLNADALRDAPCAGVAAIASLFSESPRERAIALTRAIGS